MAKYLFYPIKADVSPHCMDEGIKHTWDVSILIIWKPKNGKIL
jgi:hypothetical protein